MATILRGLSLVAIMSWMGMTAAYFFDLVLKPQAHSLDLNEFMKFVGCIFWAAPMALIALPLATGLEWATARTGIKFCGHYSTGNAALAGAVFGVALPVGMMLFNWQLRQMVGPATTQQGSSFAIVYPGAIEWFLLLFSMPPLLAAVTLTAFRALWPGCSNATLP